MLRWLFILIGIIAATAAESRAAGYIDTPDSCMILDEVRPGEVHLLSAGKCNGEAGRAFVENRPGEEVKVYADGRFIRSEVVKEMAVADVKGALDRGEKLAKDMNLAKNHHETSMRSEAERLNEYYLSREFQSKVEDETRKILKNAAGGMAEQYYADIQGTPTVHLDSDERIYVFVSSSMPVHVLRTYAADIARLGDRRIALVIRGFVGGMGKIGPTAKFVADVIKKKAECDLADNPQCEFLPVDFMVDPILFSRYGIAKVPSFVYVRGLEMKNPGGSEGFSPNLQNVGEHISISGDVSLRYVLKKFADEIGSKKLEEAARCLQ